MNPRPLGYEPSGTVQQSPVPHAPVRHRPAERGTFRQAVSMTTPSQNRGRTQCLCPQHTDCATASRSNGSPPTRSNTVTGRYESLRPQPRQRPAPSQCHHGGCHPLLAAGYRSCVFSELPDVAAAQRARRTLPQARLLTGMSCSAGAGTAESGHLVPNRSPTSSLVLLVGISHNRPAMFVQLP